MLFEGALTPKKEFRYIKNSNITKEKPAECKAETEEYSCPACSELTIGDIATIKYDSKNVSLINKIHNLTQKRLNQENISKINRTAKELEDLGLMYPIEIYSTDGKPIKVTHEFWG